MPDEQGPPAASLMKENPLLSKEPNQQDLPRANKTLNATDVKAAKDLISDLETFGDGDLFQLLSKASSKSEGWMKSTKAMHIQGHGCLVQVTTQQGDNVAEALQFIPDVYIIKMTDLDGKLIGRRLVKNGS